MMKNWLPRLRQALATHPPALLMKKFLPRLSSEVTDFISTKRLEWRDIRCRGRNMELTDEHINLNLAAISSEQRESFQFLAAMYLQHRFQLLGSDWCCRNDQMFKKSTRSQWVARNLRPAHRAYAEELIRGWSSDYQPLDWQREVVSGHRWSGKCKYSSLSDAIVSGSDVKQAWEFGRLQHLPRLALMAGFISGHRQGLAIEFRDQILDFIAMNPPGMGIQWLSPLEIAIRGANLALGWMLLSLQDRKNVADQGFRRVLARSLRDHGRYLMDHLEFHEHANNHYLGNIAGLVFIASALGPDRETDRWLAFADQELTCQLRRQFRSDGGHFEGSLSYHRFSGELAVFAAARLRGLSSERWKRLRDLVPDAEIERLLPVSQRDTLQPGHESLLAGQRLRRAADYTIAARNSQHQVSAFGDNDNGRFFTLSPVFAVSQGWEESDPVQFRDASLNHDPFLAAIAGMLTSGENNIDPVSSFPLEFNLVRALCRENLLSDPDLISGEAFPCRLIWELDFSKQNSSLSMGGQWQIFRQSGLVVFRSPHIHLAVSAIPNGTNGMNSHSHNDKLSFTLEVKGISLLRDPGTGGYTGNPELRNSLRSTLAHSAPWHGFEQNRFEAGGGNLFFARNDAEVEVVENSQGVVLRMITQQVIHERRMIILADRIRIEDRSTHPFVPRGVSHTHSQGYGELETIPDFLAPYYVVVEEHGLTNLDHSH